MEAQQLAPARRYLVRFQPKRIQHAFTDVLIIGGGIAGLRAALEVDPSLEIVIVTKDKLEQSNSRYAQGGIAAVLDPEDSIDSHLTDTIRAGKGLCHEDIVQLVVSESTVRIRELCELGVQFDMVDGKLSLTKEGGHSHRRIAHALGDATGKEIIRALSAHVRSLTSAQIWERTFTIDLLTHEQRCCGAIVWNQDHGKTLIWAKQIILATGGAGRLYRETTNPEIATADGHALAFRAGAQVRDMEFMQFHPTVLYIAGGERHLISEAVRGEGAYLRDVNGHRFMGEYTKAKELAPRDVVSRAITDQMAKTNHPCVYLDLTHIDSDRVADRFPHIARTCAEFGLDIRQDPIPVRPGAHYMIGGVIADELARTNVPGLWAAGEVTSSGLHGANRLGSNSLLEGLVFGRLAGIGASNAALEQTDSYKALPIETASPQTPPHPDAPLNLDDLRNSLISLMWRNVGIRRDREGLQAAQSQVEFWNRYVATREFDQQQGWELQNLLQVARMMISAALQREETRGVHYRSDFPETDLDWTKHLVIQSGTS